MTERSTPTPSRVAQLKQLARQRDRLPEVHGKRPLPVGAQSQPAHLLTLHVLSAKRCSRLCHHLNTTAREPPWRAAARRNASDRSRVRGFAKPKRPAKPGATGRPGQTANLETALERLLEELIEPDGRRTGRAAVESMLGS